MGFTTADELKAAAGTSLGHSDWFTIDQERIDRFAEATADLQWIHTDPVKAAAGPFGTTVAHGYLTLSLLPKLASPLVAVASARMAVNYGLNKVRFPAPVPVGSRVRAAVEVVTVDEVEGGLQVVSRVTVEREGGDKPVCVAETVSRYYF
ncbi:acyl dehydratase [Allocatelliglobosispora scoriae]|uniref:Acyl dehydratase n=1 Tax=Allocatelliglobosispora scoriae TaxID=643052 RepID=A0A841BQP4_9ACTN|nr:MaoC family dehydratase [Allocatelliglobosispora scoriae]MBB5869072.1 acyl dehydratase [Allocatelliglobosispora scoriae]